MSISKRVVVSTATMTLLIAACAGAGDDEASERAPTPDPDRSAAPSTSSAPGTSSTSSTSSTSAPTSTTVVIDEVGIEVGVEPVAPGGVLIAEDGLIVTDPIDVSPAPATLVGVGPTFLMITPGTDAASVAQSDDGLTWTRLDAEIPVSFLGPAASDDDRVVVLGTAGGDVWSVWESVDGGATWAALPPLPTVDAELAYVSRLPSFTGLAVAGDRVVALASEPLNVDWQAYAVGELGEEHGNVTGESFDGSGTVVVDFADGFQLTVETTAVGLTPDEFREGSTAMSAYAYDGSTWTRTELPWTFGVRNNVVHGPAGFAALLGQAPAEFVTSAEGITWEARPMPPGFEFEPSLAGGPLGYVVANEESLVYSADGTTWNAAYEFGDLDPNVTGAKLDAAGTGGFAFVDVPFVSDSATRVLWSPDGSAWSLVVLDQPLNQSMLAAAVNDVTSLVVPFNLVSEPPPLLVEGDLAAAIAASFVVPPEPPPGLTIYWPPVSEEEGACLADGLIEALGEQRVRESGLGAFPFRLLSIGLSLRLDADEATTVVDVITGCTPAWELFLLLGITQGTQLVSEETALCVQAEFDDDDARALFELELTPHPDADPNHLGLIAAAFDRCATEQELNAIDWN
jgi:hypothetical protein